MTAFSHSSTNTNIILRTACSDGTGNFKRYAIHYTTVLQLGQLQHTEAEKKDPTTSP